MSPDPAIDHCDVIGRDNEKSRPTWRRGIAPQFRGSTQKGSDARDAEPGAIDQALDELAQIDARKAKVIELRLFGRLSVDETAEVLKISPQSVMRDWKMARAWLMVQLNG